MKRRLASLGLLLLMASTARAMEVTLGGGGEHVIDRSVSCLTRAERADILAEIVGDFDEKETTSQIKQLFGEWKSPKPFQRVPQLFQTVEAINRSIETPDKANALFIAGHSIKLRDDHTDYPALVLGNFWTPFGVSTVCYYVLSILVLGNTPGVCLFAPYRIGAVDALALVAACLRDLGVDDGGGAHAAPCATARSDVAFSRSIFGVATTTGCGWPISRRWSDAAASAPTIDAGSYGFPTYS